MSKAEASVSKFYNSIGWKTEDGITEDARRFEDLREFIDSTIGLIVDQWYLFEHPNKMAVHIDDTLKLNLFDLETASNSSAL